MATDWSDCAAVERDPKRLGGALVFRGTRMPVSTLFVNLQAGATIDGILEWFPGMTREQVDAVIDHETAAMEAPSVRRAMGLEP